MGRPRVWIPGGGGEVATGIEPDPDEAKGGGERMVELVGEEESEGGCACGSLKPCIPLARAKVYRSW